MTTGTTEPITHPVLGTSTLKYETWPNIRTADLYHWWTFDVGPLFVRAHVDTVLQALRDAGLKPPWVQAGVDYEYGKVTVSLPTKQAEKLR